jgi:membrane protease YdiL (CAAX protease family)
MEHARPPRHSLTIAVAYLAAFTAPLFVAPAIAGASGWPINSTVTRLMIVFGVGALLWHLGVPRPERFDIGRALRTTFKAMAITVGVTALYSVGLIFADAESVRPWAEIFRPDRFATAVATGLAVSTVEEPVFRRFLFRRLSIGGNVVVGAIVSSALYSLVHYLRPAKVPLQDEYGLVDSAAVYQNILENLARPWSDPAPGLGLFLLGLFLCAVVRRGGLAWTIGIHAGVVYYVKVDDCLLYWNPVGRHFYFGSQEFLYDGAMFWIVCSCFLLAMLVAPRRRAPNSE